LKSAGKDLSG